MPEEETSAKEYEFWPDKVAKELVKKWKVAKQVIVTGTSMSGEPHIGNANDVIRGDAIARAVRDLGEKSELIWISDNMDPFRSVPEGMPAQLADYLGIPAAHIPDIFDGSHRNFADHFEQKFLQHLESVYVKPKVLLGVEMYRNGMYNAVMQIAMKKRKEIAAVLNKFRKEPLPDTWYPVDVICDNCGKIATTKILSYDEEKAEAEYFCNPEEILLHRKNPVRGCGHHGKKSILNGGGKLTWRVEWPARWVFLKATCEPFGKEHAAAGGSWDTAKEIVKILGGRPPFPVVYEHFLVKGEKMSKSRGNVITLPDMLRYMKPEHLRYWMYQGRLTIAKDINLETMLPMLFDNFDKAEKIFFNQLTTGNKRKDNNYRRAYQLACKKLPKRPDMHIQFAKLAELVKILPEENQIEFAIKKLKEWKIVKNVTSSDKKELATRLRLVKNWYEDFHKPEIEKISLKEEEKSAVRHLIEIIQEEADGEKLQRKIFEISNEHNIAPAEFFKIIYRILLKSDKGPRLGPYIIARGKEEVIKKLKEIL
jgi:lysyl-tRNA synthetase class 1